MSDIPSPPELLQRFFSHIPTEVAQAIRLLAVDAAPADAYVVGGAVRDLLAGLPIVDVDLSFEADAVELVGRVFPQAKVAAHASFGTTSIVVAGLRIDMASARSERYRRPGALPEVTRAGIDEDLRRRDFTVNAMALRLTGARELLDPTGGVSDLQAGLIRVLHDGSFVHDATRIFRALRYAARLGFRLERRTASLLQEGVAYIDTIGGERLRRELELMFGDTNAGTALEESAAVGALSAIHAALSWDGVRGRALAEPPPDVARAELGFALLAATASASDASEIIARLKLKRAEAAAVRGVASMHGVAEMLRRPGAKPSGVALLLERFPVASLTAFAATAPDPIARQMVLRYLHEWRHEKTLLSGRELVDMGVPEGPQIRQALQVIRAARLDGWAHDRGDEQALALRFAKSIRDSQSDNGDEGRPLNGH